MNIKASIDLDSRAFAKTLKQILSFAPKQNDPTKAILQGVCLWSDGDALEIAATDGHCMAIANIQESAVMGQFRIAIAREDVKTLIEVLESCKKFAFLTFHEEENATILRIAISEFESTAIALKNMGAYPQYRRCIPSPSNRPTVPTKFLEAVKADKLGELPVRLYDKELAIGLPSEDLSFPVKTRHLKRGLKFLGSQVLEAQVGKASSKGSVAAVCLATPDRKFVFTTRYKGDL